MKNLISWDDKFSTGIIIKNGTTRTLRTKPDLGFDYLTFAYQDEDFAYKEAPEKQKLSPQEIAASQKFIQNYKPEQRTAPRVFGIGDKKEFLGLGQRQDFQRWTKTAPPPGHHYYDFNTETWTKVFGVTEDLRYAGNIPPAECKHFASSEPPTQESFWVYNKTKDIWEESKELEPAKQRALEALTLSINQALKTQSKGIDLLQHIYQQKTAQALLAKTAKYKDSDIPLVLSSLKVSLLSDKKATVKTEQAKILKRADDFAKRLEAIESLRLEANYNIKNAKSFAEVKKAEKLYLSSLTAQIPTKPAE